jgi:tetratricopeptide (TPR) repeat protein
MGRGLLTAITLALAALLAGSAGADTAEARKHYDRGMRAYNLQDFKGALTEFQRAYVEMPDAAFLFNIAQAQRQLSEYEAASKSYHLYLASAPDAPNRDQVLKLIEQADHAAAEARDRAAATPAPAARPVAVGTPVVVAATPEPAPRKWYASPAGWSLAGLGVVAVAVGGGLVGVAVSERNQAVDATTQAAFDTHHNRSITLQQSGFPLIGIGGGLLVAGSIVLALHARSAHR